MSDPFQVVRDFEKALCDYTGAPYCVTTTSCTMALLLAVAWKLRNVPRPSNWPRHQNDLARPMIEIPKRTYISVPMSIIHAGGRPTFRDEDWSGAYQLRPLPVIDSARWMTGGMYEWCAERIIGHTAGRAILGRGMVCLSFHWTKTLSIGQGGAILHDDPEADKWLRRARFDGRIEGVTPAEQTAYTGGAAFDMIGWHAYMSPRDAAEGLTRLRTLRRHNEPMPNDDYPDLSTIGVFK